MGLIMKSLAEYLITSLCNATGKYLALQSDLKVRRFILIDGRQCQADQEIHESKEIA